MRVIASFPAALLAATAAVAADEPPVAAADWTITRNEWHWPFAVGGALAVTNEYGDIRVRVHDKDEIDALAHIQQHRDDPRLAAITLDDKAGPPRLVVAYEAGDIAEPPPAWRRRRVDLTVFVPSRISLTVTTRAGLAEVRGTRRPLVVTTQNGDIRLRIEGPVEARSAHGAVQVFFLGGGWEADSAIETATGSIEAILAEGLLVDAALATHGRITTDYSLLVTRRPGGDFKWGRALIGVPPPGAMPVYSRLTMRSNRGAIALLSSAVQSVSPRGELQ